MIFLCISFALEIRIERMKSFPTSIFHLIFVVLMFPLSQHSDIMQSSALSIQSRREEIQAGASRESTSKGHIK